MFFFEICFTKSMFPRPDKFAVFLWTRENFLDLFVQLFSEVRPSGPLESEPSPKQHFFWFHHGGYNAYDGSVLGVWDRVVDHLPALRCHFPAHKDVIWVILYLPLLKDVGSFGSWMSWRSLVSVHDSSCSPFSLVWS